MLVEKRVCLWEDKFCYFAIPSFASSCPAYRLVKLYALYRQADVQFQGGTALAAQAILPIATHFSVAWSVCLSSLWHICPPCLNRRI